MSQPLSQRENPPPTRTAPSPLDRYQTAARGLDVLNSPLLNKGTAFTAEERDALGLTGLIPSDVCSLETQVKRAYLQYDRLPDALGKNIYLTALHDRNEILFFRLFSEHLREMIPIVNDLTVGLAIEQYHHECRRPRGVYLSIDHASSIEQSFENFDANRDMDLILATDAEQILGIGDWGVGGIEVSIGKLAIYTAAGGIDPTRAVPVMLDVGTNREELVGDPMYVGNRHPRIRGDRYAAFIDVYVKTVRRLYPNALLLWEDLAPDNGRRILARYREGMCTFNDDIQGTGAITLAATITAMRVSGTTMRSQRVVIFGAGTAGIGVADELRNAMMREGLTRSEATSRFWCIDSKGLLTSDMADLHDHQAPYARPASESRAWNRPSHKGVELAEVVRRVKPTILVGASGVSGAFTEAVIRNMADYAERPIIFPLSHPASRSEGNPTELLAWTDGRALVATGAAFTPVTYKGITYVVGQISNAMLYPGLVLGTIVSRATRISDGMFAAAASAVSSLVTVRQPGASLLPNIDDLRSVARTVAGAVVEAALNEGLARVKMPDIGRAVEEAMWQPRYQPLRAV